MNKTELVAYAWLKRKGYGVAFQQRQSPDFVTMDGPAFEVKVIRSNSITFFASQIESIRSHPDCYMLAFIDGEQEPRLNVPMKDVPIPGYYGSYRIALVRSTGARLNINNLDAKYVDLIKQGADSRCMTLAEYVGKLSQFHRNMMRLADSGNAVVQAELERLELHM